MDLLRKYFNSTVYQAPDAPVAAADPTPPADPPAGDAAPPAGDTGVVTPDAGDDGDQRDPPKGTPWFMKRIADESAKVRAADERVAAAERRAADAQALAERLQRGDRPDAQPHVPLRQEPLDDDARINQRAAQLVYKDTVNRIISKGNQAYGAEFDQASNVIATIAGEAAPQIVEAVNAIDPDNAHAILFNLGKNPEKTAQLVGLDPARRIVELTRMSMTAATAAKAAAPTPPARTVSRAPAPPPAVDPGAGKVVDWRSDQASDAEFDAGFQEMLKRRSARR
jgi:hypothetical protein